MGVYVHWGINYFQSKNIELNHSFYQKLHCMSKDINYNGLNITKTSLIFIFPNYLCARCMLVTFTAFFLLPSFLPSFLHAITIFYNTPLVKISVFAVEAIACFPINFCAFMCVYMYVCTR